VHHEADHFDVALVKLFNKRLQPQGQERAQNFVLVAREAHVIAAYSSQEARI
jgi:hypothetical protein